jgi:hypothetical protein
MRNETTLHNEGNLTTALHDALTLASRMRKTASIQRCGITHSHERQCVARSLRVAAVKNVAEIDFDVLQDVMALLKKLRGKVTSNDDFEPRLRLALELLPYSTSKDKPLSPDSLVWLLNSIYKGLPSSILPSNALR